MYYPGQIVYIDSKDELAMFLRIVPNKHNPRQAFDDYEVLLHDPLNPDQSVVELFELKDLRMLVGPSGKTLTKTAVYYGPKTDDGKRWKFRRDSWTSQITEPELDAIRGEAIDLMNKLRQEAWTSKYFKVKPNKETENAAK